MLREVATFATPPTFFRKRKYLSSAPPLISAIKICVNTK